MNAVCYERDLFDTYICHPKDSTGQERHISEQVHEAVEISELILRSLCPAKKHFSSQFNIVWQLNVS